MKSKTINNLCERCKEKEAVGYINGMYVCSDCSKEEKRMNKGLPPKKLTWLDKFIKSPAKSIVEQNKSKGERRC
jgi:hypothetical protein